MNPAPFLELVRDVLLKPHITSGDNKSFVVHCRSCRNRHVRGAQRHTERQLRLSEGVHATLSCVLELILSAYRFLGKVPGEVTSRQSRMMQCPTASQSNQHLDAHLALHACERQVAMLRGVRGSVGDDAAVGLREEPDRAVKSKTWR